MRILLLTSGFNGLTQRLWLELQALGHELFVEFDINDDTTEEAVRLSAANLVLAPYLKRRIPERVWRSVPCWIVHPGPAGDRGPSALDWAILEGVKSWGVTLLRAEAEMDAGPVLATETFSMRVASKSSLYRHEVTDAAVKCVSSALSEFGRTRPLYPAQHRWRDAMSQADRAIDWRKDDTATVLRKIHSADGSPGLRDDLVGTELYLHDATAVPGLAGMAGALIARDTTGVYRATLDGAIRIGHLRSKISHGGLKLPAVQVLSAEQIESMPFRDVDSEIGYDEADGVGVLRFQFYNGAMSTSQCHRLVEELQRAKRRDTRALVLLGGDDHWSNGIHLNVIESTESPADESWSNIGAMNDVVREILTAERQLTIAALNGNAGAGGAFLALAADCVWARRSIVLNPHYRSMGNLFGSEYWTYVLPKRVGRDATGRIVDARLPVSASAAKELGMVDEVFDVAFEAFSERAVELAHQLIGDSAELCRKLKEKQQRRRRDEAEKPLETYRAEELEHMRLNFYGFDPSYHVARYNFVHKVAKSRTPLYLARHRSRIER